MKGFKEFIGEAMHADDFASLPMLDEIRVQSPSSGRFNGFMNNFMIPQLKIEKLNEIIEISTMHPRWDDMLSHHKKQRIPWGNKPYLSWWFSFDLNPIRYVAQLEDGLRSTPTCFWLNEKEYENKFGLNNNLDSLLIDF